MAYEHTEGYGGLFVNDKKRNEKAPDHTGNFFHNGELVKLAGWEKEGKKGKYISLSVDTFVPKEKEEPSTYIAPPDVPDDDVPF